MSIIFQLAEWTERPPEAAKTKGGVRVTRNVREETRTDVESGEAHTVYVGEYAVMSEAAYAAYAGAKEAEAKREADVIDDYTLALIEEGVL